MIIAIDGLSVNGKTTLAKKISKELNIKYFNTGAIYRCIALEIIEKNLDINDIEKVLEEIKDIQVNFIDDKIYLNDIDVTEKIYTEEISVKSTLWATNLKIKELVRKIQKEHINKYDTIIEGRDVCTRIAPNADFKFYLYSDFELRLKRLAKDKPNINIEELRKNLKLRDDLDLNGGNFVKPVDAFEINTSDLNIEEVLKIIINKIKKKK